MSLVKVKEKNFLKISKKLPKFSACGAGGGGYSLVPTHQRKMPLLTWHVNSYSKDLKHHEQL
jgi:hypothetical protein